MKRNINEDGFLGKWISGELSNKDQKAFEASEDYLAYKDILNGVERLKRPVFDIEKGLKAQKIYNMSYQEKKRSRIIRLRTWIYSAAAVFLLCIGLKMVLFKKVAIHTKMAQTQVITLPDNSIVTLNAGSSLRYHKSSFMKNRVLHLKGEAFFDVHKGSTFTVNTQNGDITVLGTEFNVYSRDLILQVHCFEGRVKVNKESNEVILTQGKGVQSTNKQDFSIFDFSNSQPDWLYGKSSFLEVPLEHLIKELERQYDVKIRIGNVDVNRIFTGFFKHNDLKVALRTSFDPMNINYTFENEKTIVLSNK